jgi:hypothetical protein
LPEARAKVKITEVRSNHARADEIERLPMDDDDDDDDDEAGVADEEVETAEDSSGDADDRSDRQEALDRERLGSRENFWGN